MSNMEQTQGVPAGWLIERRAGDWFSLRAPDGCEWNFCDDEGFDGPDRLICKLLDAMLSAAPQAQPVAEVQPKGMVEQASNCKKPFFAHDPENGTEWFATEADAIAYARASLAYYQDWAQSDGEWSGDVEHVKIGRVTHIAGESGNEEDGYNYSIRPLAAEATPSPAPAQAQPVEAEQATSETPEKTPTGYSRPPNGEPAHPEDWNAGYEAGLADGREIGADAGRLPVAWMYEHDGCNDEPILTAVRWPECREPWNETPLDALALAKHAIEKVWLDAVGTGNGEHSISEAARARVEFAADALKLGLRLPDALRKTGVESPLPKPAQPVEAEQVTAVKPSPIPVGWSITDNLDGSITVERRGYQCRFWKSGHGGGDAIAYELAHALLKSQPVQPVREPMSWDLFVAACEAEYGEEFCPNNLGDVSDEEKAELMRVVSIVERHHGIGSKGGAE